MFTFRATYFPIVLLAGATAMYGQGNALTAEQKQVLEQRVQTLENNARAQADKQTAIIAEIAKKIDRNLLSGAPSEEVDRKLSADFATEVTKMVNSALEAKLAAVREMVKVLTPEQKAVLLTALEKPGANPDLAELVKVLK